MNPRHVRLDALLYYNAYLEIMTQELKDQRRWPLWKDDVEQKVNCM